MFKRECIFGKKHTYMLMCICVHPWHQKTQKFYTIFLGSNGGVVQAKVMFLVNPEDSGREDWGTLEGRLTTRDPGQNPIDRSTPSSISTLLD